MEYLNGENCGSEGLVKNEGLVFSKEYLKEGKDEELSEARKGGLLVKART